MKTRNSLDLELCIWLSQHEQSAKHQHLDWEWHDVTFRESAGKQRHLRRSQNRSTQTFLSLFSEETGVTTACKFQDKDENEKEKDKEQMGASPAQQKDMVCFCCGKKKAIVLMNVQTQTKHQKPNGHARKAHKCTFRKLKKIQMKKRKTTMMKTKANLWKTNQEPDGTTWCVVLVVHRNTGKWIAKKMQFWALAQHSVLSRTRNCCTTSRKQEAKSKCR